MGAAENQNNTLQIKYGEQSMSKLNVYASGERLKNADLIFKALPLWFFLGFSSFDGC